MHLGNLSYLLVNCILIFIPNCVVHESFDLHDNNDCPLFQI